MTGSPARADIRDRALALGFDAVGFAAPDGIGDAGAKLTEFIATGWHGDMGWMADTVARRRHPNALWPEARTVVMVALNYGPESIFGRFVQLLAQLAPKAQRRKRGQPQYSRSPCHPKRPA